MALIVKCPITGAAFRLPMFSTSHTAQDSSSVHIVSAPHPVLAAPVTQLAQLPFPDSPTDRHIILCAWLDKLAQINIVHWRGVLNPLNFSERWFLQQFEQFATIAYRLIANVNHPTHTLIPQLTLNGDLNSENLQSWRESAQEILSNYCTFFESTENLRKRDAQAAAAALLDSLDNEYNCESLALRQAKHRRNYVHASLMFNANQEQVEVVLKVLAKPFNFELVLLQQVKAFCLDFLPENGHENYNDKQEVIALLDAAILDRVGMAQVLGVSNITDDAQAAVIRAQYTTTGQGAEGIQTFVTAANPKVAAAINRTTQHALAVSTNPVIASEPKREDYKMQFLYDAATRLWRAQQATAAAKAAATATTVNIGELL